jgi:xanthine dehydrogenase accessory factor
MNSWISALGALAETGTPAVLVTVLEIKGSTPREAGAKMVVTAESSQGTIGGGHLEFKAIELARELLASRAARPADEATPVLRSFALGPSLGQCCGGEATLVFEPVLPPRFQVALFGAGHVGKALVKLLADLPCRVTWIDSRAEAFPAEIPANAAVELTDLPEEEVVDLPHESYVLVLTHSHALDLRIVERALRRPDLRYVGLIGSKTKRARFLRRLALRGLAPEEIARLTCPIGIEGVAGKRPAEIAIAVAAQLLQLHSAATRAEKQPVLGERAGTITSLGTRR